MTSRPYDRFPTYLNNSSLEVARRLLGTELVRTIDGHEIRVRIVETEAYDFRDAASHSYRGKTPRTEVMFGPSGHLYVYFTYGMHYCMNVVTGGEGEGSAVLIRAVEVIDDKYGLVQARRQNKTGPELTNGPAKLCQALAITKEYNGHDLHKNPLQLVTGKTVKDDDIVQTTRIGISKAVDMPWRFYIRGNPYVSRP